MMDAQRIKELLDLCEKATPGPWEVNREAGSPYREVFAGDWLICDCGLIRLAPEEVAANAEFIAAARTALPEALRELSLAMEVISTERDFVQELEQKDKALASWQANMEEWQRIDRENRLEIERLRKALHESAQYTHFVLCEVVRGVVGVVGANGLDSFTECTLHQSCKHYTAALGKESQ